MHIVKVEAMNKKEIPPPHETIADDIDIDLLVPNVTELKIYYRSKEKCPYNRGNWIIDIIIFGNQLMCIKLPKEMSEDDVIRWFEPLKTKLEAHKLKGKH